jgi:hypothetical protein
MQQADGWFAAHGVKLRDLLAADDAVQISSGREHRAKLLYRLPPGVEPLITKQIKIDGAMILEFRCAATGGSGCQDVLPPTIHPNTDAEYQWSGAGDFNNLPFLPEQLLKIWRDERGPDVSRLHEVKRESDAIVEGSRNTTLFQLAGDLFGLGLYYESVLDVVMKENAIKCAPSLPPHEVEALVRSAQSNSRGSKQMADQQALNAAVEAAADAAAKEAAEQVAPDDFVAQLPTVLQDIAVWYEKRAVMPQPAFKVAIALAAAGAVLARDFTGAGGAFTHLYCVLIGPPGSGKEAALRSVKDIVTVYDASRLPGNPASDAGVLAALMRDPASCFVMDELGEVLKGIFDSKAAGYKAAIGTTFLELYSKGGTRYFGREYAKQTGLDGRARVDIYSPCPSIFGTTTPSTFYAALSSDAVSSGFAPRLLTFRAPDKIPYMKEPEDVPLPTSVCNWLNAIKARVQAAQKGAQAGGNLVNIQSPRPIIVPYDAEAKEVLNAVNVSVVDRRNAGVNEMESNMLSRQVENAARLALILALAENPQAVAVRAEHLRLALNIVGQANDAFMAEIRGNLFDSKFAALEAKVLDYIKEYYQKHGRAVTEGIMVDRLVAYRSASLAERLSVTKALERRGMMTVTGGRKEGSLRFTPTAGAFK